MTTQTTEYKCATCGAVSVDADSFAKHNLIHDTGKKQDIQQEINHPVQDASWQSPASTIPQSIGIAAGRGSSALACRFLLVRHEQCILCRLEDSIITYMTCPDTIGTGCLSDLPKPARSYQSSRWRRHNRGRRGGSFDSRFSGGAFDSRRLYCVLLLAIQSLRDHGDGLNGLVAHDPPRRSRRARLPLRPRSPSQAIGSLITEATRETDMTHR